MAERKIADVIKENIDIVEYARHIGLDPIPHGKRGKYTSSKHDSLIITPQQGKEGIFTWNSRQASGSVIDLAMAAQGISEGAAIRDLRALLDDKPRSAKLKPKPESKQAPEPPREMALPDKSEKGYQRVFAYLTRTREIDPAIVQDMVKNKLLMQDQRGNCCFVGWDYDNLPRYAALRGTASDVEKPFRGEVADSRKEVAFTYNVVNSECTRLVVTEAPIDALAFMSMLKLYGRDYKDYSYLALGGTYEGALLYHVQKNPEIQRVYLCQDNDEAGFTSRTACRRALQMAGFKGEIMDKPPRGKDYNDDLKTARAELRAKQQIIEKGVMQHEISHQR